MPNSVVFYNILNLEKIETAHTGSDYDEQINQLESQITQIANFANDLSKKLFSNATLHIGDAIQQTVSEEDVKKIVKSEVSISQSSIKQQKNYDSDISELTSKISTLDRKLNSIDTHDDAIIDIQETVQELQDKVLRRDSEGLSADLVLRFNDLEKELKNTKIQIEKQNTTVNQAISNLKIEVSNSSQATSKYFKPK